MNLLEFKAMIPSLIQQANDIAKKVSEDETELTASIACLEKMDGVVEYLHRLWMKSLLSDNAAWNCSVIFGSLLGEMIIGEHGFQWSMDDAGMPLVETEDRNRMFPITKVYKIITDEENCEGSPSTFYEGFKALQHYYSLSDDERSADNIYGA